MVVIGLTGSIGMGKSTTANIFRSFGLLVHDSDAVVHAAYGGAGAAKIDAMFPGVLVDGAVDRAALSKRVLGNPTALRRLESFIHPVVGEDRDRFIREARERFDHAVVLDIPLLFEIGGVAAVDVVVVVSAPIELQKSRVLARPGMTLERFEEIVANQIPDSTKRKSAHFVVDTGSGLPAAEVQVRSLLKALWAFQGGRNV